MESVLWQDSLLEYQVHPGFRPTPHPNNPLSNRLPFLVACNGDGSRAELHNPLAEHIEVE